MAKTPELTYAYGRAVKFLSIRPRSTQEIRDYLARKGISDVVGQEVVERLSREKFLDDEEFAEWWIRGRKEQGKAEFLIRRELENKGVVRDIIDRSFGENLSDDVQVAREVVLRNHRKYSKYSGREYNAKMGAFLARRGFSWEVIRKALVHEETE